MYEAVIFDFDGTIIDTEGHFFNISNAFLRRQGADVLTEAYYGASVGGSGDDVDTYLTTMLGVEGMRAIADEHRKTSGVLPIFEHIQQLIAYFKAQAIPMAIATSSYRSHVTPAIQALGLDGDIRVVVGREDVATIKPAPDLYLEAAKQLNVRPDRCLAFEDSVKGATAAVNASMDVVVMTNDFTQNHDFSHVPYLEKNPQVATLLAKYFK